MLGKITLELRVNCCCGLQSPSLVQAHRIESVMQSCAMFFVKVLHDWRVGLQCCGHACAPTHLPGCVPHERNARTAYARLPSLLSWTSASISIPRHSVTRGCSLFVYRYTCPAVIHQWGHALGRHSMAQSVQAAMASLQERKIKIEIAPRRNN